MKRKLTKKEEELMTEVRDEWIGLFNSLKFDEKKAKSFAKYLYSFAEKKYRNPIVLILDSPLACQYAANMIYGSQVDSQVDSQVKSQVMSQMMSQVELQVESQVRSQVKSQVRSQVMLQVISQVKSQVISQVKSQVRSQVDLQVELQVVSQMMSQVDLQVKSQVELQVGSQVDSQVDSQVVSQVRSQVKSQVELQELTYIGSGYYCDMWWTSWYSFYDYFVRIGIVKNEKLDKLIDLMKSNVFIMLTTDKAAIISRPPIKMIRRPDGALHSTEEAAIQFKDGYCQHYVNGVFFSPEDFEKLIKNKPKPEDIMKVKNTEQKAVLIQHWGYDYIFDHLQEMKILDTETKISKITRRPVTCRVIEYNLDNITLRAVVVEDHSVHKKTILGVPREPKTKTVRGALAWTFDVEPKDYELEIES